MNATAHPLTWPVARPRTKRPTSSAFDRRRTFKAARETLFDELRRIGATSITLSTNLQLRLDGIPRSGQAQPDDRGVAVYFQILKITQTGTRATPIVLACDRWDRVECNVYAIAQHIEATRAQERWGVGTTEQAFAGHALPPPAPKGRSWRDVLNFDVSPVTPLDADSIEKRFRILAAKRHPDHGGTHEQMTELNAARAAALAELEARR